MSVLDGVLGTGRVNSGAVTFPAGSMRGARNHALYQLVLPRMGVLVVQMDGQRHTLQPGQVGLLTPGHRVDLGATARGPSEHAWLVAQRPALPRPALDALHTAPQALAASRAMTAIFDAAADLESGGRSLRLAIEPLVCGALAVYLRDSGLLSGTSAGREHPAIVAVRDMVRQRLDERLTLTDLAAAGLVAPEHLVRLFRRYAGTTPYRYLWDERVRLGIQLLEHTGEPVTHIARRCGFRTSYHFARMVRTVTGLSPTQVRHREWDPHEMSNTGEDQ